MDSTYTNSRLAISSMKSLSYQQLFGQIERVEGVGLPPSKISRR